MSGFEDSFKTQVPIGGPGDDPAQQEEQNVEHTPTRSGRRTKQTLILVAIGVVTVIIAVALGVIVFSAGGNDDSDDSIEVSTVTKNDGSSTVTGAPTPDPSRDALPPVVTPVAPSSSSSLPTRTSEAAPVAATPTPDTDTRSPTTGPVSAPIMGMKDTTPAPVQAETPPADPIASPTTADAHIQDQQGPEGAQPASNPVASMTTEAPVVAPIDNPIPAPADVPILVPPTPTTTPPNLSGGMSLQDPDASMTTEAPVVAPIDNPIPAPTDVPILVPPTPTTTPPNSSGAMSLQDHDDSVCDEDVLGESASELTGLSSPVFQVGDVDILDLILTELESAKENAGFRVFLPEVVCAGAAEHVDVLGAESGVISCSSLTFLDNANVLAFGVQRNGVAFAPSFCAAFNPFTGTVGIAQSDILPTASVAGILTLSLDAVGFSLTKDLSETTRNKMWNDTGEPAAIDVAGHVIVKGTGNIGFKASEKISVGITVEATLLVDADYSGDGLQLNQVLRDSSDDAAVDLPDFALLLSGTAYPTFTVTTVLRDGEEMEGTIDLSQGITASADIFTIVEQGKSSLQLAASIDVSFQGLCDASVYLEILCVIFDGDSNISGAVRSFVNPEGFGVMWEVVGFIGLQSDFLEFLLGWPDDGLAFDAEISLVLTNGALSVCARTVAGGDTNCWGFCNNDSQCKQDQFCDALGACIWKKNVGGSCLKPSGCKSDICNLLVCSECSKLDTLSECPSGTYCGTQFPKLLGLRCFPQLEVGASCSNSNACGSGYCVSLVCSECPVLDGTQGCPSDEYCGTQFPALFGLRCLPKLALGAPCSKGTPCRSGICKDLFCSECSRLDTLSECPRGTYCGTQFPKLLGLRCFPQLEVGASCSNSNACGSGYCVSLVCSECPVLDGTQGCPSDEYCGTQFPALFGLRCLPKLALGAPCSKGTPCRSGICKDLFCSECSRLDTLSECPRGTYCGTQFPKLIGLRCFPQLELGAPCSNGNACGSGYCVSLFCSECPVLDGTQGCPSNQFCGTQFPARVGLRCEDKRPRGGLCSSGNACQSGKCGLIFCR